MDTGGRSTDAGKTGYPVCIDCLRPNALKIIETVLKDGLRSFKKAL